MWMKLPKLNLARRYLWGALVSALIPLILIAFIYDRYSADLLNTLVTDRLNSQIEVVAARMRNYLTVKQNWLENISDLRGMTVFFQAERPELSAQLTDLLLLEVQDPDVYAIELSDPTGAIIKTVPASLNRDASQDQTTLPHIEVDDIAFIGPKMPTAIRPGWILIRKPVFQDQELLGYVAIRSRLASLTELSGDLFKPGVHAPQLVVLDRIRVSVVGTESNDGQILAGSHQFLPGWRLNLVAGIEDFNEPRLRIRYLMLFVASLSALVLVVLFFKMSQRLSGYLSPLTAGAQAIANGDFSIPVSEEGPGELGTLARSHNRMREQLENLIASRVDIERRATLGNMAAGIAHEIRNPLTTVAATLHGLSRGETDTERKEMYGLVSNEINRVDQTISEFVNFAKPRKPQREDVRVSDVFTSVKTLINATAHEKSITISVSGDTSIRIHVDPAQLRQILLNLSLNAIDAMPEGGQLRFRSYTDEKLAKLVVADNGHGIAEEVRSKILRPFFTTRAGGTGLGLSITSQLVEANSGTLTFASVPGEGTTVSLLFPFAKAGKTS